MNELEEDENDKPNSNSKIHYKQPIKEFDIKGWESLDENGKTILKEHFSEIFNEEMTYQKQLKLVHSLIYSPIKSLHRGYLKIGCLFGISKGSAYNTLQRLKYEKMPIGRPPIFTEEEMVLLNAKIKTDWDNQNPPTLSILNSWIYLKFHKLITNNTLSHTLSRFQLGKTIIGYPTELNRIEVPLSIILDYYDRLNEILKAMIPAAFIFNVDECGFQPWADKTSEKVIVPINVEETSTNVGVDRASRRATLIGCVCADGSALKPLIIITRKTKENALAEMGYNPECVEIVYQANGFVTGPLFDYWAQTIFFPELRNRRIRHHYEGPALLLFDGCTAHSSDFFMDECTYYDVIPIQEPASSSDQVQVLDIGIFGIQKNILKTLPTQKDCSPATNQIVSIVDSWQRATLRGNVTSAFRQAGFVYSENESTYYVSVDPKKTRCIRGVEHEENHLSPDSKKRTPVLKF